MVIRYFKDSGSTFEHWANSIGSYQLKDHEEVGWLKECREAGDQVQKISKEKFYLLASLWKKQD